MAGIKYPQKDSVLLTLGPACCTCVPGVLPLLPRIPPPVGGGGFGWGALPLDSIPRRCLPGLGEPGLPRRRCYGQIRDGARLTRQCPLIQQNQLSMVSYCNRGKTPGTQVQHAEPSVSKTESFCGYLIPAISLAPGSARGFAPVTLVASKLRPASEARTSASRPKRKSLKACGRSAYS